MSALQLFCLPHARGSAAFYRRWSESLPEWIQVHALELPPLGSPAAAGQHADIGLLVRQLAATSFGNAESQPHALFGHGLGGLLAYELAHWLRQQGAVEPLALFVSGVVAPSRCERRFGDETRTDNWLYEPDDEQAGVMLSADLPDAYHYRQRAPLRACIHVLDRRPGEIRGETLLAWQQETRGDFSLDLLERHHFFIQQQEARTLRLVCRYCERHLRRWRSEGLRATG